MRTAAYVLCVLWTLPACGLAAPDDYDDSIRQFLREHFAGKHVGMVIGVVDATGPRVYAAGGMGEAIGRDVDGDTVFEIGSTTKTFTSLLLLEMAARGEVAIDDPVSKYLPTDVKMPAHGGEPITVLHLAAQEPGLPFNPDNYTGESWDERFRTYTPQRMYDFLASHELEHAPGESFIYSNLGMGLLGHALERKGGKDFEALVVERICAPLRMDSTRVVLDDVLRARFAMGHDRDWKPAPNYELPAIAGAGALRSTGKDLLKYVAAQLGLSDSTLAAAMRQSHVVRHRRGRVGDATFTGAAAMPWWDDGVYVPEGSMFLGHGGGTGGYTSFIGLDLGRRRGVVVLTNQKWVYAYPIGWRVLQRARLKGFDPAKVGPVRDVVIVGLGLEVEKDTGRLRVASVVPASPASKTDIAPGSVIASIDGVSTQGKTLPECTALLRGDAETSVQLAIVDPATQETRTTEVTRERVRIDQ